MKKIIVLLGVLLHASPFVLAQIGSITPARPSAGSPIVLRYDAANKDAALHAPDEVFATMEIIAPSGSINRTIKLLPGEGGALKGSTELPEDAVYLRISFTSRWAVDSKAGLKSMVYTSEGEPVLGSRVHAAVRSGKCLEVVAAELKAYPESYGAYRSKWVYNRLFRRGEFELQEVERDLTRIGSAQTPSALLARVHLQMLCGKEPAARDVLLRLLKVAPRSWSASQAVRDYSYFSHSGVGTAAGQSQVRRAVQAAMLAHPDSHLVRQNLYDYWPSLDFESVQTLANGWLRVETQNPLPHAILAASSNHHKCNLEVGFAASISAVNGFLKGDGRIASRENHGLEGAYLPWSHIVTAQLALSREDIASAIAYAKGYSVFAPMRTAGHECEARAWEKVQQLERARGAWLEALALGSDRAKKELRRLWNNKQGSDSEFQSYLTMQLQSRRPAGERAQAPAYSCTDMNGRGVDSDALRGRVVVLNFWGLGCMPCKIEIPSLNKLKEAYSGKPVEFLAFAPNSHSALASYIDTHPFTYRLVADDQAVQNAFEVSSLPVHVVIDGAGRIIATLHGAGEGQTARLASLIDLALAER